MKNFGSSIQYVSIISKVYGEMREIQNKKRSIFYTFHFSIFDNYLDKQHHII